MENEKPDDWIQRLTGDEPTRSVAIAELRELLVRGLNKSLTNRYGTAIQVEDVAQEALIKILASLDKFEGRSRFTTWAMTVATRVGISELRRKHYQDVSLDSMKAGNELRVTADTTLDENLDEKLDQRSLLDTLKQLVETALTDKQRQAIQGSLDGLPVEEIARRTGSNRNAVYKLIHDARIRLRDGFSKSGILADDVNSLFA